MQLAVKHQDFGAFIANVEKLGRALGATMPRAIDDINELPDEVQ